MQARAVLAGAGAFQAERARHRWSSKADCSKACSMSAIWWNSPHRTTSARLQAGPHLMVFTSSTLACQPRKRTPPSACATTSHLANLDRAFRSIKTIDLKVRPIPHRLSGDLIGTKRMLGRATASQIATESSESFLFVLRQDRPLRLWHQAGASERGRPFH